MNKDEAEWVRKLVSRITDNVGKLLPETLTEEQSDAVADICEAMKDFTKLINDNTVAILQKCLAKEE